MNKELKKEMNGYISNIAIGHVKVHNLHWNIIGKDFQPVHAYLEKVYECYAAMMDAVAEEMKMINEYPVASMEEMLKMAEIEEIGSEDIKIEKAMEILQKDIVILKEQALKIRSLADDDNLFTIANMMEDHVAYYQKTLWFLRAMGIDPQ